MNKIEVLHFITNLISIQESTRHVPNNITLSQLRREITSIDRVEIDRLITELAAENKIKTGRTLNDIYITL